MASPVPNILADHVANEKVDYHQMSIDALLALVHSERLKTLKEQSANELKELSVRQSKVRELHDLMKALNKGTTEKGDLDLGDKPELAELLQKAKEHGVNVKEDKRKFSKDERDRLVENVNMTIQDLNVQNDMQMQTVQRLTNERYESFQLVRNTIKPLDEAKKNNARKAAGPTG